MLSALEIFWGYALYKFTFYLLTYLHLQPFTILSRHAISVRRPFTTYVFHLSF